MPLEQCSQMQTCQVGMSLRKQIDQPLEKQRPYRGAKEGISYKQLVTRMLGAPYSQQGRTGAAGTSLKLSDKWDACTQQGCPHPEALTADGCFLEQRETDSPICVSLPIVFQTCAEPAGESVSKGFWENIRLTMVWKKPEGRGAHF